MTETSRYLVEIYSGLAGIGIIGIITFILVYFDLFGVRSSLILLGIISIIVGLINRSSVQSSYNNPRGLQRSVMFGSAHVGNTHESIGNKNRGLLDSDNDKMSTVTKICINGGLLVIVIGLVFF